jgi:hypothetical protein
MVMMAVKDESMVLKAVSLRSRVRKYLNKHPTISVEGLYFMFPKANKNTLRNYQKAFRDEYNSYDHLKQDILILYRILERKSEPTKKLSMKERGSIGNIERYLEKEFGEEFLYG